MTVGFLILGLIPDVDPHSSVFCNFILENQKELNSLRHTRNNTAAQRLLRLVGGASA